MRRAWACGGHGHAEGMQSTGGDAGGPTEEHAEGTQRPCSGYTQHIRYAPPAQVSYNNLRHAQEEADRLLRISTDTKRLLQCVTARCVCVGRGLGGNVVCHAVP